MGLVQNWIEYLIDVSVEIRTCRYGEEHQKALHMANEPEL